MLLLGGRSSPCAVPDPPRPGSSAAEPSTLGVGPLMVAFTALLVRLAPLHLYSLWLVPERPRHGDHRAPAFWQRLAPYQQTPAHLPQPGSPTRGGRISRHSVAGRHRIGRVVRHGVHAVPQKRCLPAGAAIPTSCFPGRARNGVRGPMLAALALSRAVPAAPRNCPAGPRTASAASHLRHPGTVLQPRPSRTSA